MVESLFEKTKEQLIDKLHRKLIRMNEVEMMYRNAKVEQKRMCEWTCKDSEICNTLCEHYESTQLYYSPFTAEKQLELIKWLMNKSFSYSTVEDKDGVKYWFEIDYETSSHGFKSFEETIADTINEMWQNLTDTEKEQIKEILK